MLRWAESIGPVSFESRDAIEIGLSKEWSYFGSSPPLRLCNPAEGLGRGVLGAVYHAVEVGESTEGGKPTSFRMIGTGVRGVRGVGGLFLDVREHISTTSRASSVILPPLTD